MIGHGAKLDHKKEQAIVALLSHRTMEEAARAIEISPTTLQRWTKEPDFKAACREARLAAFSQSIAWLAQAPGAAVNTLLKIMLDATAPPGARLRAAEIVLDQTAKGIVIETIEQRVAELERALEKTERDETVAGNRDQPKPRTLPYAVAQSSELKVDKIG